MTYVLPWHYSTIELKAYQVKSSLFWECQPILSQTIQVAKQLYYEAVNTIYLNLVKFNSNIQDMFKSHKLSISYSHGIKHIFPVIIKMHECN